MRIWQCKCKITYKNNSKRFHIKNTKMKMASANKAPFAGVNDKRYYFLDGIVSFPYDNPPLLVLRQEKGRI